MSQNEAVKEKQKKIEPRRLKGFKDHLPGFMEVRSNFQNLIRQEALLAGFSEIGTPTLEYLETLLGQGSEETDKQVYRFEDHGGRKVGLRFDLTIPFARFVAEHQSDLIFPFKRLQIGDVWRGENTQKGRYREFCQCDLDIIGVDSVGADFEVIACLYQTIAKFNTGGYAFRLGNRNILSSLIRKSFNLGEDIDQTPILIALDKLDKIGTQGVIDLLSKIAGSSSDAIGYLLQLLVNKDPDGNTDLVPVRSFLQGDEKATAELDRFEQLYRLCRSISKGKSSEANPSTSANEGEMHIDLSIARGLGYYTGVVFETTLNLLPGFGSICSGGRYDDLAERFTTRSLPGVGGSIGLDRLLAGLEELGRLPVVVPKKAFVAIVTADALEYGNAIATTLRKNGVACDIGLTTGKVGLQFKHADRIGCPFVIVVGTDELNSKTFNLKNMKTGEESKSHSFSQVVQIVKTAMSNIP
ncbi:MAG: histidine--tRNA ligase [Proteobacteria bacterium]|nr:histidine--tRNA ligase [Pseudomonadota bacterium]